jgi:hypothetical protein
MMTCKKVRIFGAEVHTPPLHSPFTWADNLLSCHATLAPRVEDCCALVGITPGTTTLRWVLLSDSGSIGLPHDVTTIRKVAVICL